MPCHNILRREVQANSTVIFVLQPVLQRMQSPCFNSTVWATVHGSDLLIKGHDGYCVATVPSACLMLTHQCRLRNTEGQQVWHQHLLPGTALRPANVCQPHSVTLPHEQLHEDEAGASSGAAAMLGAITRVAEY